MKGSEYLYLMRQQREARTAEQVQIALDSIDLAVQKLGTTTDCNLPITFYIQVGNNDVWRSGMGEEKLAEYGWTIVEVSSTTEFITVQVSPFDERVEDAVAEVQTNMGLSSQEERSNAC